MSDFAYVDGCLHAEGVSLEDIAAEVGTPFYCYSVAAMESRYKAFAQAFGGLPATVCYSVKANSNLAVIRTLARLGAGVDVVSGGELTRALRAGVPAERIVFSGVGKTAAEIGAALQAGILQINIESEPEMDLVNAVAGEMAGETAAGPASFQTAFIDTLYALTPEDVTARARIEAA